MDGEYATVGEGVSSWLARLRGWMKGIAVAERERRWRSASAELLPRRGGPMCVYS